MAALRVPSPQAIALAGRSGVLDLLSRAIAGTFDSLLPASHASSNLSHPRFGAGRSGVPAMDLMALAFGGLSDNCTSVAFPSSASQCSRAPAQEVGRSPSWSDWVAGFSAVPRGISTDVLPTESAGQMIRYGGSFVPSLDHMFGCFGGFNTGHFHWSRSPFCKLTILCCGSATGVLLCQASTSKDSTPPGGDGSGGEPNPEEPEDVLKKILRLVENISAKLPDLEGRKPIWIVRLMQRYLGKELSSKIVSFARLVKNQWDTFYFFILFGLALVTLKINPVQGFHILKYYLGQERDAMQMILSSHLRNSVRERENHYDDSVCAVSFSIIDLETNELKQIQLFMRGEEGPAVFSLLEEWALGQPRVKDGIDLNQFILFLRSLDSEALSSLVQALAKGEIRVTNGKGQLQALSKGGLHHTDQDQ